MPTVVKDLGNRYGSLGSVLVRHDNRYWVVSSTKNPDRSMETRAYPATATGRVTSWREVAGDYGMTIEEVVTQLEDVCHCGARLNGSDHCPADPDEGCGCEQYQTDCGARP